MRKDGIQLSGPVSRRTHRRAVTLRAEVAIASETAEQVVPVEVRESIPMQTRSVGEAGLELISPFFLPKNTLVDIVLPEVPPPPLVDFMADPGLRIKTVVRKIQMTGPEPEYTLWLHLTDIDEATKAEWDALVDPKIREATNNIPAEPEESPADEA